jgi:cytochrome c oxidase subunit 3
MSSVAPTRWDGGVSPFNMTWSKLMMWWFIVTDGLLFAGFLGAYGYSRGHATSWPEQSTVFNMKLITAMTFILISSSATMATAVAAARKGDLKAATRFIMATVAGGAIFLGLQAYEWSTLIREGARPDHNPWGVPAFSAYFFLITGFHGTHVLIGGLVLAIVAWKGLRGKVTADGIELAGLYWHFVDLVWVFVFGCFYLI